MGETGIGGAFRKMKEVFKDMTPRQRLSYFWYYYKGLVIGGLVVALLLGGLIYEMSRPTKEALLNGMAVNVPQTEALEECLTQTLFPSLGGEDPQTQALNLSYAVIVDARQDSDAVVNNNYSELITITAQVATGNLDYLLTDGAARDFLLTQGLFCDLTQLISGEQLSQISEYLVYQQQEDGSSVPVGVDLTGTAFGAAFAGEDGELFLGFPGNTSRSDKAEPLLTWLLAWEPGNFVEND